MYHFYKFYNKYLSYIFLTHFYKIYKLDIFYNMNPISKIAICKSLNFPLSSQIIKESIKLVPDNTFGVFVTVRRSEYQKLDNWPEDIHGCIGYWDNNYAVMDKNVLIEKMISVGHSATWEDNRKNYFSPVYEDAQANYEVDFMLKPIYNLDPQTGKLDNGEYFNNNEYGLIVDTDGKRATYLPHVFEDAKWEYIRDRLIKKAGSSTNGNKFVAYKVKMYSGMLFDLLNEKYLRYLMDNFVENFLNKYYGEFIPYIFTENERVETNKTAYVRNIATLTDILMINSSKLDKNVKNKIVKDVKYYANMYPNNQKTMRQASAFLLLALNRLSTEKNVIDLICKNLYQDLNNLERNFELGEALIALTTVCPNKTIILNELKKMMKYNKVINKNDIFRLNWEAKFLHSLWKNSITNKNIVTHANQLAKNILSLDMNQNNETNYLAVTFEALSSLLLLIQNNKLKVEMKDRIFKMFYLLQQRLNKFGLYEFTNRSSRLDITGHVFNAFFALIYK